MKKILLIEDNKGITEGLCDTFTEPEYELLTAGNLKEAGALLSEHPGLVLLDVSLPDGNGFDFYSERLEKEKPPVIFLTARDEENDIVKGLELGAEDYITKPFSVRELVARVKRVFLRRKSECGARTWLVIDDIERLGSPCEPSLILPDTHLTRHDFNARNDGGIKG